MYLKHCFLANQNNGLLLENNTLGEIVAQEGFMIWPQIFSFSQSQFSLHNLIPIVFPSLLCIHEMLRLGKRDPEDFGEIIPPLRVIFHKEKLKMPSIYFTGIDEG